MAEALKTDSRRQSMAVVFLVGGLAAGAILALAASYAAGFGARTITRTQTSVAVFTVTIPMVVSKSPGVEAGVTSCQWSGSQEYCELELINPGVDSAPTSGNCTMAYSGHEYGGFTGPPLASAGSPGTPQQIVPGGTKVVYCQASTGSAAGSQTRGAGNVTMADGEKVGFSGTAES